jgi:hypothetical protein
MAEYASISNSQYFGDRGIQERHLLVLLLVVGSVTCILSLLYLFSNRKEPFVTKRGFWSSFISALGSSTCQIVFLLSPLFNLPCYISLLVISVPLAVEMFFFLERCLVFYCHFVVSRRYRLIARDNFDIGSSLNGGGKRPELEDSFDRFIWNHRRGLHHGLNSSSKMITLGIVCVYCFLWNAASYFAFSSSLNSPFYSESCQNACYYQWVAIQLHFVPSSLFSNWIRSKLMSIEENLLFHEELFLLIPLVIFPVHIGALFYFVPRVAFYGYTIFAMIGWFANVALTVVLCCTPLIYSRRLKGKLHDSHERNSKMLIEILQDDGQSFQSFVEFLRLEFLSQNVFLWKSVESLKTIEDDREFLRFSQRIYDDFFSSGASIQVRLSPQISSAIQKLMRESKSKHSNSALPVKEFKEICLSLYAVAQREIFLVMLRDSLPRYIQVH